MLSWHKTTQRYPEVYTCLYKEAIDKFSNQSLHTGTWTIDLVQYFCEYVCICVYIYIYIYIFICTYIYIYIYTDTDTDTHTHTQTHTQTHTHTYTYTYTYTYIYIYTYTCAHIIYMYMYVYVCVRAYIYIYIQRERDGEYTEDPVYTYIELNTHTSAKRNNPRTSPCLCEHQGIKPSLKVNKAGTQWHGAMSHN